MVRRWSHHDKQMKLKRNFEIKSPIIINNMNRRHIYVNRKGYHSINTQLVSFKIIKTFTNIYIIKQNKKICTIYIRRLDNYIIIIIY